MRSSWATRRTPIWIIAAIVVIAAGAVVVSLTAAPSKAQRASDLRGYFGDVNAGIESCAGGLRDARTALGKATGGAGSKSDDATAAGILGYNAQNCSPANNESLQDFTNYQVAQSLDAFRLDTADNDVVTWAFDAQSAQDDMLAVLHAATPAARNTANAALTAAWSKLHAERAAIYALWHAAQTATGDHSPLPNLPI